MSVQPTVAPQPRPRMRAVAWARVSTAEQAAEGRAGIPRQKESARRVAQLKDYDLLEVIELADVSGTATLLAPEFQRLLALVEGRRVDVVMVSEMSRLLRPDDLASLAVLDVFRRSGVLLDMGGSITDLASPEGFLSGGIQAILGGHERMQLMRKMHASKEERRRGGRCPSAAITLPTGIAYCRRDDRWETDDEIWKVRELFRLLDEGETRCIAEAGRRVGLQGHTAGNLLRNPIYKGIRVYDKRRDLSVKRCAEGGRQGDRPKVERPPEDVIRVRVFAEGEEPVPPERWERVQEVIRGISMAHRLARQKNARVHLLSGIARCGFCGERMYTRKRGAQHSHSGHLICVSAANTRREPLPRCAQPWNRIEALEELALAYAREVLSFEDLIADLIGESERRARSTMTHFPFGGPEAEKQFEQLRRREERLLEAFEGGAIGLDELRQRRARLAEERERIRQLADAQQKAGKVSERAAEARARRIADGARALDAARSPEERREALRALFSEIYFRGESIVSFAFAPALLPADGGQSFPLIAHGLVSLAEPFRLRAPQPEPPAGMKFCVACGRARPFAAFPRKRKEGGDGAENRRNRCTECTRAACREAYRKRRAE